MAGKVVLTVRMPNPYEEGINERMKRLLAMPHCPQCALLPRDHDDDHCDMRYERERQR